MDTEVINRETDESQVEMMSTEATAVEEAEVKEEVVEGSEAGTEDKGEDDSVSIEDIVADKPEQVKKAKAGTDRGIQKRFDELTKAKYELEAKLKEYEASRVIPQERPLPPDRYDFEDNAGYAKAMLDWKDSDDAWKARNSQIEAQRLEESASIEANSVKFMQMADRMRGKYQDFDDVVFNVDFTRDMKVEIEASDLAPEIAYYLCKNQKEFDRLSGLSQNRLAKEIGKLEVRFSEAKSKAISNAPKPLAIVEGNDKPNVDDENLTDAEWIERDRKRELEKIKKRASGG